MNTIKREKYYWNKWIWEQSISTLYLNPGKNTSLKTIYALEPGLEADLPFLLL